MEQLTLILIVSCFIQGIISDKEVILNFKLICYENSKLLNPDIGYCKPQVVICISYKLVKGTKKKIPYKKCPIYYQGINHLSNKDLICSKKNRKIPIEFDTQSLTITSQERIFVKISVKQCGKITNFQATYLLKNYKEIEKEDKFGNNQFNIRLSMRSALKIQDIPTLGKCQNLCEHLYNDELCLGNTKNKFCKSSQQQCLAQDTNLYKSCLEQTKCKDETLPSCSDIIKIKLLTCSNIHRNCTKNVRQFLRKLTLLAEESKQNCENPINLCKLKSYHNGCIPEDQEHLDEQCICKSGFSGAKCDIPIINFIWIPLAVLLVLTILIVLIIFYVRNKKKNKRNKEKNTIVTINLVDPEKPKQLITREISSNIMNYNIYQDNNDGTTIYDSLDETYMTPKASTAENDSNMNSLLSLPKRDPAKSNFLKTHFFNL